MPPAKKYNALGLSLTIAEWSARQDIPKRTLSARIDREWPIEIAVSAPPYGTVIRGSKKLCTRCGRFKSIKKQFSVRKRSGRTTEILSHCKSCECARTAARNDKIRLQVIHGYTRGKLRCAHCPEHRLPTLDIDHVRGDGSVERRNGVGHGYQLYLRALREKDRKKYRVLCRNCNWMEHLRNRKFGPFRSRAADSILAAGRTRIAAPKK